MKTKIKQPIFYIVLIFFIAFFTTCKDDDIEVPLPSTQANFDYEVETIIIDEDLGTENYQVTLFNKSLLATSYSWDFGNGDTSAEENPTVTYTIPGRYNITLTVTSDNDLYYSNLSKSVDLALGKQVLFYDDFVSGIDFTEEDIWAPEGWKIADQDGDGYNWFVGNRNGVLSMRSQSYAGGAALTPDNWLILPETNLIDASPDASITFRYNVGITATTKVYRQEHYGIFISVGTDNIDNFELLFEETMTQETSPWTPLERNINISDYAGEVIYLAIRHYNVTDMDRIFIEDVEIFMIE